MAVPSQLRKIALVGATGTIGAPILKALVAKGHQVRVLTRTESKAVLPETVDVRKGSYDDEEFLVKSLEGQDVLVLALGFMALESQVPLIKAAAKAGVSYVLPTEYGSDVTHPRLSAEWPMLSWKIPYRKLVEDLGVSSWLGVTNNPWFEYVLAHHMVGLDLSKKTALLLDGGNVRANFTTFKRVGESLAAVLALPEAELSQYKNNWVYFSSFVLSQRDLLESAKRVTGTTDDDWTITHGDANKILRAAQEEAGKGNMEGAKPLLMGIVFQEGLGGDYIPKVVDYKRLGLEPEDLDEEMRRVISSASAP
jgi:hypothetical protein